MTQHNIRYTTPSIEDFYKTHRVSWEQFYPSEQVVISKLGLHGSSKVLDIGCSCGGLGLALRERFGVIDYTGIEINQKAAETTKAMNPEARVIHADILSLSTAELPENSFDVVFSLGCIDWNVQFSDMLGKAYRYVKPDGHFLSSFRLTMGETVNDFTRSYQYINFEGKQEGEIASYVVMNARELLSELKKLKPQQIVGYGYWGTSSTTAVTPYKEVCFAVMAVQKRILDGGTLQIDLDLPDDVLSFIRN
ncbi:MAG: class I SAM-dependent DNA methyltransferase [Burkholderiales bacterium]